MLTEQFDALKLNDDEASASQDDFLHRRRSEINPFFTDTFSFERVGIFTPAVNSSGDIYHIAAYLLLAEYYHWEIPMVYVGSDTDDTKKQAARGLAFMQMLNLGNYCSAMHIADQKCFQASPRMASMRNALSAKRIDAVEQKLTTALISLACVKYGVTVVNSILRRGFVDRSTENIAAEHKKLFAKWLELNLNKITKYADNNKFVVIHNRCSKFANSGQSLSESFIQEIVQFAVKQGIKVFRFDITDEVKIENQNRINVFASFPGLPAKYDKVRHLHLLHGVSKLPGFVGIIGGTSGTLDVAAFMGIRVFNFHQFSITHPPYPYQDYRILLHYSFMTLCARSGNLLTDEVKRYLLLWLTEFWILRIPTQINGDPNKLKDIDDTHKDRLPFQYCILLKSKDDEIPGKIQRGSDARNAYYTAPIHKSYQEQKDKLCKSLSWSVRINQTIWSVPDLSSDFSRGVIDRLDLAVRATRP